MFPLLVTGGPTVNPEGIFIPTLVTVPTDQVLLDARFCVKPLIVRVLVVGTGV